MAQVKVGNVTVHALLDVRTTPQIERMFASVPAEDWDQYRELYPWAFGENGTLVSNATAYLVQSQGRNYLVDLGLGPGPHQAQGGASGELMNNLAATGITPDQINDIMITHLHGDHIGWAATGDAPTFPNARIIFGEGDWTFFSDASHPQAARVQATVGVAHGKGLVDLINGEHAVNDEITMIPTHGHTPGHYSVLIRSNGEGAIITGDCVHSLAQVAETDWSPAFDNDADLAAEARWNVVQKADVEKLVFIAGHFPFPGWGRISRIGGRRGFERLSPE